jgi:membrane-associated phospholipid phosphatase
MGSFTTRRLLAALFLIASAAPMGAQADTVRRRPFFTWRDAAILEAFAIATVAAAPLDTRFANKLQNRSVQENRLAERTARVVETITDPGSFLIGIGMYGYGRLRDNQRAADLGLHGTEALFLGAQLGNLLKGIVGRARPYVDVNEPHDYEAFRGFSGGTDYRAFPSGHAISAFAAAAAVTSETKRWWPKRKLQWIVGPVMYGGAAAVGWSRMYDNKHWASDVLTGAAIGTFTGLKVVHFHHHTKPNNLIDRFFLGGTVKNTNVRFVVVPAPPRFLLPASRH